MLKMGHHLLQAGDWFILLISHTQFGISHSRVSLFYVSVAKVLYAAHEILSHECEALLLSWIMKLFHIMFRFILELEIANFFFLKIE